MMAGGTALLQSGLGSTLPSQQTSAVPEHSRRRLLWRPEESAITAPVAAPGGGSDVQAAHSVKASSVSTAAEGDAGKSSRRSDSLLSRRSSGHVSDSVSSGVSSSVLGGVPSGLSDAQSDASCSASAPGQAVEAVLGSVQFVRLHEADGSHGSRTHNRNPSLGSLSSQGSLRSSAASTASSAWMSDGSGASPTASFSSSASNRNTGSSMSGGRSQSGNGSHGSGASCVLSATTDPLSDIPHSPHRMAPLADHTLHGSSALPGAADTVIDQGSGSSGSSGAGDAADAPCVRLLEAQLQPPLRLLSAAAGAEQLNDDADAAASGLDVPSLPQTETSSSPNGETAHLRSDADPIAAAEAAVAAPAQGSGLHTGAHYEPLSSVDTDHASQQPPAAAAPEQVSSHSQASLQTDRSVAMSPSDVFHTPPLASPPPQQQEQQQSVSAVDALLLDIPAVTPTSVPSLHVGSPENAAAIVRISGEQLLDTCRSHIQTL